MALLFTASADRLVVPGLSAPTLFTCTAWLRNPPFANTGPRIYEAVHSSSAPVISRFFFGSDGRLIYQRLFNNTAQWEIALANMPALDWTVWHHVAVVHDASALTNDPVFYIDGTVYPTTETTTPSGTLNATAVDWSVGNRPSAARPAGELGWFGIYSATLSALEVLSAMRRGFQPANQFLVLPLLQTTAPFMDLSGNGRTATVAGGAPVIAAADPPTTGQLFFATSGAAVESSAVAPPEQVTDLVVDEPVPASIRVAFTMPDGDVSEYVVRWKVGSGQTFADETAGNPFSAGAATPLEDVEDTLGGFAHGATYTIAVFAGDGGVFGPPVLAEFTTEAAIFPRVATLRDDANRADGDIGAAWGADTFDLANPGLTIVGNRIGSSGADRSGYRLDTVPADLEFWVTMVTAPLQDQLFEMQYRVTNPNSPTARGYAAQFYAGAEPDLFHVLLFRVDAQDYSLVEAFDADIPPGTDVGIAAEGHNHIFYLRPPGELLFSEVAFLTDSSTDAFAVTGHVGLYEKGGTVRLDNVSYGAFDGHIAGRVAVDVSLTMTIEVDLIIPHDVVVTATAEGGIGDPPPIPPTYLADPYWRISQGIRGVPDPERV